MSKKLLKIIFSLLICQLAGLIGAIFNGTAVKTWYAYINKPGFTPPNWIFGPVWITLYLLMGISLFLVWNADIDTKAKQTALVLFFIQLILNTLWSYFFFYLQSPLYGLIEIVILSIFIILTILRFFPIRPLAGFLLVPYALWVGFAAALNYSIWHLNR
jgi:benzodiazapine receptor